MKLFFDMLPIILFFITYKVFDIYVATATAIVSVIAQIIFFYIRRQKPETMHWVTLFFMVCLGGATLYLQDEIFIKWKPTAVYWILGLIFLFSEYIGHKNLVQRMLDKSVTLPKTIWHKLNLCWVAFFAFMGLLNIYVVYHFDTDTWVNFKLFGTLGLTIVFVVLQAFYLAKFMPDDKHQQNGSQS